MFPQDSNLITKQCAFQLYLKCCTIIIAIIITSQADNHGLLLFSSNGPNDDIKTNIDIYNSFKNLNQYISGVNFSL